MASAGLQNAVDVGSASKRVRATCCGLIVGNKEMTWAPQRRSSPNF